MMTPGTIAMLLEALMQPDTGRIREAKAELDTILKNHSCVEPLVQVLRDIRMPPAVRQMAATILCKCWAGHFYKFDPATQRQAQKVVFYILRKETPERVVRKAVVRLMGIVFDNGPNIQDLEFIIHASKDDCVDVRELAFWSLKEVSKTLCTSCKGHLHEFEPLFPTGLQDPSPKVQVAAIKALGWLMTCLVGEQDKLDKFCGFVPTVLQVARHCSNEDTVSVVLDLFFDLCTLSFSTLKQHLPSMVRFSLDVMRRTEVEIGVRDKAALLTATLAEAQPKAIGEDGPLLAEVLDTVFRLMGSHSLSASHALYQSNPSWREDDDDDDDFDSPSETSMAQGMLDVLACEVPNDFIFEPVAERCAMRLSSPNAQARKAGVAGLGVIAEGCQEPLKGHLNELLPHLVRTASDTDVRVREWSCFTLGQLSQHLQPEIFRYANDILQVCLKLLHETSGTVQTMACYVLEMFCEQLEPQAVRRHLDELVRMLGRMMEQKRQKRSVQEMAIAALSATALAAEEDFSQYVQLVVDSFELNNFLHSKDPKKYSLRGRALECMGHMAIAVGKNVFRPYFSTTIDALDLDSTDLPDFAYSVLANLVKVMEDEFAPILPDLVPHLLKVIRADEGQVEAAKDTSQAGKFEVQTALLEAKKGAITALGEMATHTGRDFCPYLEETKEAFLTAASLWHPRIKCEVAEAFPLLLVSSIAAYGEVTWVKGDLNGPTGIDQRTAALAAAVLKELITLMEDRDKDTVGKACEGIQSVIETCGPQVLVPVAQDCFKKTHDLLCKQAPCQRAYELADDDDEHEPFMKSVCDLVGSFCRVTGSHFAPSALPYFLPAIRKFLEPTRPASDRSMGMGCLSEISQELGEGIRPHWGSVFLPDIIAGLGDPDVNVKRNAAFCAGTACEGLGESAGVAYPQLLQSISPLFSVNTSAAESSAACVDNAAAAITRMIMACPNLVPMAQVLPVLLKALPLRVDMSENKTVYRCLLSLLRMKHVDLFNNKEQLKRVFVEATSDSSNVEDGIKAHLKETLQSL